MAYNIVSLGGEAIIVPRSLRNLELKLASTCSDQDITPFPRLFVQSLSQDQVVQLKAKVFHVAPRVVVLVVVV